MRAEFLSQCLIKHSTCTELTVITTQPNRYPSIAKTVTDENRLINIIRIKVPLHKNGFFDQMKSYSFYCYSVFKIIRQEEFDLVIATSSRLFTACLASLVAYRLKAKFVIDLRDILSDSLTSVFKHSLSRVIIAGIRIIETWTLNRADAINIISPAFISHLHALNFKKKYKVFTNGVDDDLINENFFTEKKYNEKKLILYAGNIGFGQGLHRILPQLASQYKNNLNFRVIGDGAMKKELFSEIKKLGLNNIQILDSMPRGDLMEHYREADIFFIHLNDVEVFERVLPSKIFEYAATKKPIIAGVSGFPAEFIRSELEGVKVFRPCDIGSASDVLKDLNWTNFIYERKDFFQSFSRQKIYSDMAEFIMSVATND